MSEETTAGGSEEGHVAKVKGRVPPADLDAEASVLAAILLEKDAIVKVRAILPSPRMMYSDANARVLEAAYDLHDDRKPVDITTVAAWLRSREWIDQVGGPAYLVDLVDKTPSVANVAAHAQVVAEKHKLRQLIGTCQRIAAEGYGDVGDVQEFLDGTRASIQHVCTSGSDEAGRDIDVIMQDVYNELTSTEPDDVEGMYTGIHSLDRVNGPLRPGSVTTVLAYSSHGKSAFCAGIVNFAAQLGPGRAKCKSCGARPPCPWRREYITQKLENQEQYCEICGGDVVGIRAGVLVFSGEMKDKDYAKRMVQIRSRINLKDFKQGIGPRCSKEEYNLVLQSMKDIAAQKNALHIDHKTVDVIKIRSIVERKKIEMAEDGIELIGVIFDYAQRAKYGSGVFKGNRQQELAAVGRHLKDTAIQESVAIVLPAQLNEEARRKGLKPNAENVREAQDLVQDSDNTIIIYAPCRDASVDKDLSIHAHLRVPEPVQFRVGKGRDGQRGFVQGAFLPWITTFDPWISKYGEYVLPEEQKEERGHERRGRH
jgi:replicative DNA helicase